MKTTLKELTQIIRSKNSGPYELTMDLIFRDRAAYELACEKKLINSRVICELYHLTPDQIINIIEFDPANAIKITVKRPICSGDLGERDVYGAQQHAPLLDLSFDLQSNA